MLGHSLLYLSIATLAGIIMALQGSINSVLGEKLGLTGATFIVHMIATVIMIILLVLNIGQGDLTLWRKVPWYLYLGGLLAVLITYGVVITIPKLGVAVATTAIITGQVLTAAAVDHFGLFGLEQISFTWIKFIGIIFLAVGVRLLLN